MNCVREKIKCERTLNIITQMLKAGYVDPENGRVVKECVGTPQGNVVSPLLANIVLHKLDVYMDLMKKQLEKSPAPRANPKYTELVKSSRRAKRNSIKEYKQIMHTLKKLPSKDQFDPFFKRLLYIRYADDFVVLIIASHKEVVALKNGIAKFLSNHCGLELNEQKTLVTRTKNKFKFLGALC